MPIRMLILKTQAGTVIGKGGAEIAQIRNSTKAQVRIIRPGETDEPLEVHESIAQVNNPQPYCHIESVLNGFAGGWYSNSDPRMRE